MDEADSLEHKSRRMTILGPLVTHLHTASLGHIIALVPVISDLMHHPVPPQVARQILHPQNDIFILPEQDIVTSAELALALKNPCRRTTLHRCMRT